MTAPDISFETITAEPVPEKVIYIKGQLYQNPLTDQPYHKDWTAAEILVQQQWSRSGVG